MRAPARASLVAALLLVAGPSFSQGALAQGALAQGAFAQGALAQEASMLGRWEGTFIWETDPPRRSQATEIELTTRTAGPGGTQRFLGNVRTRIFRIETFAVMLDLDPRTRAVRMTAAEGEPAPQRVGVFVGTVSADGGRIDLRFTRDPGEVARLVLTRAGGGKG